MASSPLADRRRVQPKPAQDVDIPVRILDGSRKLNAGGVVIEYDELQQVHALQLGARRVICGSLRESYFPAEAVVVVSGWLYGSGGAHFGDELCVQGLFVDG